jgi:serine/threonine protein kinase
VLQLVEVIDDPAAQLLYAVMEYVVGGPVMEYSAPRRQYVSSATQGVLSATSSATLFWDMLAGLEYLHTNCIAHRDLKPEVSMYTQCIIKC